MNVHNRKIQHNTSLSVTSFPLSEQNTNNSSQSSMRRAGLEDLHRVQLGILECVTKFCDEHKIKYWLDYGTLLGAVRHKGYIPWDDDIDIGMMREDYEKFRALFNSEQDGRYQLHCMENDPDYVFLYRKIFDNDEIFVTGEGKVRLEDIDIFIYDNVPDDDDEAEKMFGKRDSFRRLFVMSRTGKKPGGNIFRRACVYLVRYMMRTFLKDYFLKRTVNFIRSYEDVRTKRVGGLTCWESLMCRREVFEELIELNFEGRKYKAPANYDEWLTTVYGDYMKLPPVEERVPKHTNNIELYIPV